MCLAVPGKIVEIIGEDPLSRMGKLNFGGVVLQDGKIDDAELKQAKPQWKATIKTISDAWIAIRGKPSG